MQNPKIFITFDLEEFDLPLEYGQEIAKEEQLAVSRAGAQLILEIIAKYDLKCTFFSTAFFAENNPDLIKMIVNAGHEIASHLYFHSQYEAEDLIKSKLKLEEISGKKVSGFRSPRLRFFDAKSLQLAGYQYDSSLNPCYIPFRYNNFKSIRNFHKSGELAIFPMSVATNLRIPLFWLSFKLMPYSLFLFLCKKAIKETGFLHLYFHPWEFIDLDKYLIPSYLKINKAKKIAQDFERLINDVSKMGEFYTLSSQVDLINQNVPTV
jgi:hypothetical protein